MYELAIEILSIFHDNGYLAYIVGGYPRDRLLGINTNDIDICANALPNEIMELFDIEYSSSINYGSVKVNYKNYLFDITTFRKDIKYKNNRCPSEIIYVDNLLDDLYRRDFTVNTICIDKDNNYIDMLNGMDDLNNKIIRTVGNPQDKLKEDALRILRAIRFASLLGFDIDKDTEKYIIKYGHLLNNLSGFRKREEIDKMFSSLNRDRARDLIIGYGLDKYLGINNLSDVILCDNILGIWSQLELVSDYPFTRYEMDNIKKIKEMLKLGINDYTVYKYGLDISIIVGSIKGISEDIINNIYNNLVIHTVDDIKINAMDIALVLDKEPSGYISEIFSDIKIKIINRELENTYDTISKYIKENY